MVLFPNGKSGAEVQESLGIPESIKVGASTFAKPYFYTAQTLADKCEVTILQSTTDTRILGSGQ